MNLKICVLISFTAEKQQFIKPFFMAHWLEEGEAREGVVKETKELLPLLEAQLKGKRFFGGDAPGYLDIAANMLGPSRMAIEEVTGVALVNDGEYPALCQWAREYISSEALKPCMPDRDKLVAYFTKHKDMYTAAVKAMLQK
jgi:glutathione S-transferase